jgi:SAM-dependent methyltransferase
MGKQPVDPNWFTRLYPQTRCLREDSEWLTPLRASVESIANFGCWKSHEPFALMWTLDATEVVVIEKEVLHLDLPKRELERLRNTSCLQGRSIEFIVADMSTTIDELPSDRFDLAYCENVLYQIYESGLQQVQSAIGEMTRVVRPGGWIIAVEPRIGAELRQRRTPPFDWSCPGQTSYPKNISPLFEEGGLVRVALGNAPDWSYCYVKADD